MFQSPVRAARELNHPGWLQVQLFGRFDAPPRPSAPLPARGLSAPSEQVTLEMRRMNMNR